MDSNAGAEEGEEEEEAAAAPKKRKSSVFNKEKRLSPALAAVIGEILIASIYSESYTPPPLPLPPTGSERASRPQVVKLLWVYIKANNLQNPSDKRKIILDEKLKAIFPRPVNAFSLNTYLSAHIMDDDECYGGEKAPKASKAPKEKASKKKVKKEDGDEDDDDDEEEEDDDNDDDYEGSKKRKRKSSGSAGKSSGGGGGAANNNFNKPLALSAKLAAFIGKSSASRPEINSFINNYCKEHNLHNPANRQYIICNDVLKDLFEVDTFRSFGEPMKLIKPHVSKLQ